MRRKIALRRALRLEVFTVAWNVLEAVAAVGLGFHYNSVALAAFGFDSMIETAAAGVLAWRLSSEYRGASASEEDIDKLERKASFWVGITFFLLTGYVLYESLAGLISKSQAHPGAWGVALAILSAAAMLILWRLKLKAANALGSSAMRSEAAETVVCAYLSIILLAGLLLNYSFGIWWADPAAALVMLYFIIREGVEALNESRGKGCCCGSCDIRQGDGE